MRKSLGLLEIKGLASAIVVADTMAKTAAVTLVGIESCKGGGWQTIKIIGDVAAVQAALSSGSALAKQTNSFIAMKTLSRPDQNVMATWGDVPAEPKTQTPPVVEQPVEVPEATPENIEPVTEYDIVTEEVAIENEPPVDQSAQEDMTTEEEIVEEEPEAAEATCNLCGDPLCPRSKGEPHTKCIHNTKVK